MLGLLSFQRDLALVVAIPIVDPLRVDLDEREARSVDAFLEPGVEVLGPMFLELILVANEFGATFDSDEERLHSESA